MKKITQQILVALAILFSVVAAKAATVTVTVADDGVSNIGAPGTFYWAITNCQPGDTIAFNIPGTGPFYLQEPLTGFPLIYQKHRITIDGYTQPGASPNTNPNTAANNANIQIVIDGRNSGSGTPHARNLNYSAYDGTLATSDPPIPNNTISNRWNGGGTPYGAGDFALLGVYRSTNVTIKGLAFLGDNLAVELGSLLSSTLGGIAFMHDYGGAATNDVRDFLDYPEGEVRNCHVCGCWFGVNPTNVTKSGLAWMYTWLDFSRHKGDDGWANRPGANSPPLRPNLPNVGLNIGVAAGASNPRSEFNVFVAGFTEFGGEPIRLRISGNFIGFMPDGVTPVDPMTDSLLNGNSWAAYIPTYWPTYGGAAVGFGRFGETSIHSISNTVAMVYGTDGDGVNDADEGNLWGPLSLPPASNGAFPSQIALYRTSPNLYLVAGNRVGIGNDGTIRSNNAYFISGLDLSANVDGQSTVIMGSDFASSSSPATIAAQANHIYNNVPVSMFYGTYGTNPPSSLTGVVPFLNYQHPAPLTAEIWSTNAYMTLRGNVLVGNGLGPWNYADGTGGSGGLLTVFTNEFALCCNTSVPIIPVLSATNFFPNLAGTFAPGVGNFTNVIIDVYQLDPYGWTNGQAFALRELIVGSVTNGFPQGNLYLGSFPVANTGSFNITLPASANLNGSMTVTANYSKSPAGTAHAVTMTSDFSMPTYMVGSPTLTITKSGANVIVSWDAATYGSFTVQTNASVVSPGTWGNFTVGNVAPPVSVPVGTGPLFIRAKKL